MDSPSLFQILTIAGDGGFPRVRGQTPSASPRGTVHAGSGTAETWSIGRGHSNICPDTVGAKDDNNKNRDIGVGIIRSGRAA